MFIQTEQTPNPATLKFIPPCPVLPGGIVDMPNASLAARSPLAQALFQIPGVSGVLFGPDFLSVTKSAGEWEHLKPAILGVIMTHFLSNKLLFYEEQADSYVEESEEEFFDPEHSNLVITIKGLLEDRVRPAVLSDGGDITFQGYRDGIVYLRMKGACSGCPSSTATLKHSVQNLLRHFVPEIQGVEQI